MKNPGSVNPIETTESAAPERSYRQNRLRAIFWLLAIVLGALHTWATRHFMNPDGVSYLDMADAYLRGDWSMAVNAYWSPLYSWLIAMAMLFLKPSPYWEFSVVHLVNFAIYLFALGCFDFFLLELTRYHRRQRDRFSRDAVMAFPEWAWLALGYTLFIWSSLKLITIYLVTPDMCVAAIVYLASGILLRIRSGSESWLAFGLLGATLGIGYLAKTPMFPLAFVFLGVGMFSVGSLRRALPRVVFASVIFLLVAAPFVIAISNAKGRFTIGDSAKLNYSWYVNRTNEFVHWQGGLPNGGTPVHTTRKILDVPAVYEFGTPIGGTYPAWYDPSYWHEGIVPNFDFREQIRVLILSAKSYYVLFFNLQGGLIVGSFILYFMSRRGWLCVKDTLEQWFLLVPAAAALGMYSLVLVEARYIGAFVVLLWAGVFSAVRLPVSNDSRRLVASVSIAMVLVMMVTIGLSSGRVAYSIAYDSLIDNNASYNEHWRVADGLNQMGVQPGDKVAFIGNTFKAFWARLARVRIVAEIPSAEVNNYLSAKNSVKSQVLEAFAQTGARAIVTGHVPDHSSAGGWQKIVNTDYYAYFLKR